MKKVFLYFLLITVVLTSCNQAAQPIKREYVNQQFAESLIDASIQGKDRQTLMEEIMDKPKDFFPTNVLPENIYFSYVDETGKIITNHPDFQLNRVTRSENGTWIDQTTGKASLLPLMLAENRDTARFGEESTLSAQGNPNCSPYTSRGGNSGPFRKVEAQPGYNRLDLSLAPIQNRPDNYWGANESPHIYMGGYVPGKSFVETGVFYNDKSPTKVGDPPRGWAPFMNIGGSYVYGDKLNSVLRTSPHDMLFLVLDDFDNNGKYIKTILNLSVYTNVNGTEIFYSISTRNTTSVGNTPGGFREQNGQQILKRVVSIAQQVVSSGKAIPCEIQTNKAFTAIIKRASLYYINFPGSRPYGDWNPKDTRMTSKITNYAGDYVNGTDASLNYRTPRYTN